MILAIKNSTKKGILSESACFKGKATGFTQPLISFVQRFHNKFWLG